MKTLTNKDKQVCSACGGTDCASFMAILPENKKEEKIMSGKTIIEEVKEAIEILKEESEYISKIEFQGENGHIKISGR